MHAERSAPYDPPRAEEVTVPAPPNLARRARLAVWMTASPFLALALVLGLGQLINNDDLFGAIMAGSALIAIGGVGLGLKTAWTLLWLDPRDRPKGLIASSAASLLGVLGAVIGAMLAYVTAISFSRGRQLRQRGTPLFAPLEEASPWILEKVQPGEAAPAAVIEAWRTNGLTEHASVAAFAQLSIDLIALGAPPRLIEAAHRDAIDEMRHTELCFSLARDLGGAAIGPKSFPQVSALPRMKGPRTLALAKLAVESLIDGAINEGVSARVVAELSRNVEEPRVKAVLMQIAKDEARHAAHGFDVLRWCVEEGGAPVKIALRSAIATLPERPGAKLDRVHDSIAEAWGIPSQGRIERVYGDVRRKVEARVTRALG